MFFFVYFISILVGKIELGFFGRIVHAGFLGVKLEVYRLIGLHAYHELVARARTVEDVARYVFELYANLGFALVQS